MSVSVNITQSGHADTSSETLPLRQVAWHESSRQTVHVIVRSSRPQLRRRQERMSNHRPLQVRALTLFLHSVHTGRPSPQPVAATRRSNDRPDRLRRRSHGVNPGPISRQQQPLIVG